MLPHLKGAKIKVKERLGGKDGWRLKLTKISTHKVEKQTRFSQLFNIATYSIDFTFYNEKYLCSENFGNQNVFLSCYGQ